MRMFDKLLKQAPIFKDTVLAIGNITKTVNDLVRSYTQMARMVIEDRKAIAELYELHTELVMEQQLRARGNPIDVPKGPVIDVKLLEEDIDKKKKAMN